MSEAIIILSMLPFAAIGVFGLSTFVKRKLMVKKGYFLVKKHLSNGGVESKFIKPNSTGLEFKSAESDNVIPLELKNSIGWVCNDSGIPTVEYNSAGKQISFESDNSKSDINADEMGNLMNRMYNLGQINRNKKDKILLFGAYAAIGALLVGALTLMILFSYIQNSGVVGVISG